MKTISKTVFLMLLMSVAFSGCSDSSNGSSLTVTSAISSEQELNSDKSEKSTSEQSLTKVFETNPTSGLMYTSIAGRKVYDCSVNVNADLTEFAFFGVSAVSMDNGVGPPRRDLCEYSVRELFGSMMYVVEFPVSEAARDSCRSGGACDLRTAELYTRHGELRISVTVVNNGAPTSTYGACFGLDLTLLSDDKNCRAM